METSEPTSDNLPKDEIENENLTPDEFWVKNDLYHLQMYDKRLIPSTDVRQTTYTIYRCTTNDLYHLQMYDKRIQLSVDARLNDSIMDATQILIGKALGRENEYQSVLNLQKKLSASFRTVNDEHIQLLHVGVTTGSYRFVPRASGGKMVVSFLPVSRQNDGYNCGVFAIAFAAEILDGESPIDAHFYVKRMRSHIIRCLENKKRMPFPKVSSELQH